MKMLKNKTRFFLKLYIIIWCTLIALVLLKLLFGYWQPYIMPNEKMQILSDFIDKRKWLVHILDGIFYMTNGLLVMLCSIKQWWFRKKWNTILVVLSLLTVYLLSIFVGQNSIITLIVAFGLPLIIDYRKWLYILVGFILSNVFLFLSLWFNGNTNTAELPYFIQMLFLFDYCIMLFLQYITTNLIKFNKKGEI